MLAFKDFMPQIQKKVLGLPTAYEDIHEVFTRVKRWLEQEQIQVINVETLLLPALPNANLESAPSRMTGASGSTGTFQVIRVWYHDSASFEEAYTGATKRLSPLELSDD